MKVRIHYTLGEGTPNECEDSLILEADTTEEIQKMAAEEVEKRNATNPWSEEL